MLKQCAHERSAAVLGVLALATSVVGLLASGCATDARDTPLTPQSELEKARFYWPYAALAADVYRTRGEVDSNIATALASPWLRYQVEQYGNAAARERFQEMGYREAETQYRVRLREQCRQETETRRAMAQSGSLPPSCQTEEDAKAEDAEAEKAAAAEPNRFKEVEPQSKEDCEYSKAHEPSVPVNTVSRDYEWYRVPELQRQTQARGWRLFVPELAIDVWRRQRDAATMEYAVVYRGTVGGGGWVSNFRGLTAMTPFVWDQYGQAYQATIAIINQVDRLHAISDHLLQRHEPTRLLFTAVGHSLGGGLAKYIYLRVPRVTRVVAFDPSPIDGSSTIPVDKREEVADASRPVDLDPRDSRAAMHVLFEDGEFISQVTPCHSGAMWGDEGGPWVRCERVNLSRGNTFRQHNMAQLACKLYLVRKGIPAR